MILRVLDFDLQAPLRSQAIYHGLASVLTPDASPILALVTPNAPYVCVGMHQDITREIDTEFCAQAHLPVIRRAAGGGAVYLDANQLFFYFIYPRALAPRTVDALYPYFIAPVVCTYQALGINAYFKPVNDIHVAGRKIGGTGAATIGHATVFVGSFLLDFDTARMAQCLLAPSEDFRNALRQCLAQCMTTMKKEGITLPTRTFLKQLFVTQVAAALQVTPEETTATSAELSAIAQQEQELADPEWINQSGYKLVANGVKIAADIYFTQSIQQTRSGLIRAQLLSKDHAIAALVLDSPALPAARAGLAQLAYALIGFELVPETLGMYIVQIVKAQALDMAGVTGEDITAAILSCVHRE